MNNPGLHTSTLKRFITSLNDSLSDSLHSLCDDSDVFDSGMEIVGYINFNIDRSTKLHYVLDERVERSINDSVTYDSNSFLAQRKDVDVPVSVIPHPVQAVSTHQGLCSRKITAQKRKRHYFELEPDLEQEPTLKTASIAGAGSIHTDLDSLKSTFIPQTMSRVVVERGPTDFDCSIVKTEEIEMQKVEPSDNVNDEEDDPTDIEAEVKNDDGVPDGGPECGEHSPGNTDESQPEGAESAGTSPCNGKCTILLFYYFQ